MTYPFVTDANIGHPTLPLNMSPPKSSGIDLSDDDLDCLSISELEKRALGRMDKQTRDYYNEGADSGVTLLDNIMAYQMYRIRPRIMRDVSSIDSSVVVFGHRSSAPFGIAPAAMQKLAHPDGELATARACARRGIVMGLSSFSTTTIEDVRQASGRMPNALQLYLFEDRSHSRDLIARAKMAGYKAVILTVDTPVLGRRRLEIRNQFRLPSHLEIANFASHATESEVKSSSTEEGNNLPDGYATRAPQITFHTHGPNPTLEWKETMKWLKHEAWPMQVWLKGILTPEDASLAVEHGADGIIVSNHGGRQLDGALATLDALPDIVAVVGRRIPVHVDGGIRLGSDIFKALALGADFCWVGRPALWGLAYKGQVGVELCLRLLIDEFRRCMGLSGVTEVKQIGPDYLCKVGRSGFVSRL